MKEKRIRLVGILSIASRALYIRVHCCVTAYMSFS